MSGKTTLAKRLEQKYNARGIKSIVLDPNNSRWQGVVLYEPDKFLNLVKNSRQCAIFLDESGETVGKYNDEMFWLATRARHWGHKTHFITQRPAQLSPTIRSQCSEFFIFTVNPKDAESLSLEVCKEEIKNEAPNLEQFQYLHYARYGVLTKNKL